jgi:hypothetical protein
MRRASILAFVLFGLSVTSAAFAWNPFDGAPDCTAKGWSCEIQPVYGECFYCRPNFTEKFQMGSNFCELTGLPKGDHPVGRTQCYEALVFYNGKIIARQCNDTYGQYCSDLDDDPPGGGGGGGDPGGGDDGPDPGGSEGCTCGEFTQPCDLPCSENGES